MEEKNTTMGTTETMEDYKEALEASYRRIRPFLEGGACFLVQKGLR